MLAERIMDLGKCSNQKMHESESAGFPVLALPEVQNQFRKRFSHKVLCNYGWIKFSLSGSVSIQKSKKNGFPIVFSKSDLDGGHHFKFKKKSDKAKQPSMCPSIGGNVGETLLHQGPIIILPYHGRPS